MSNLLASEKAALELVRRIGDDRAQRLLSRITTRIQRRIDKANRECLGQFFDSTSIAKADWEVTLDYQLKLGLNLNDNDTPEKAHQRILERRKRQREERQRKRQLESV